MLTELLVRNIALIDEVHIRFDAGLHALTGETGAGKSIVIDDNTLLIITRSPEAAEALMVKFNSLLGD